MKKLLTILSFILAVGFVSTVTQVGLYQVAHSNNGSVRGFSFDPIGDMFAFLRNGETIRMSGTYTPAVFFENCTGSPNLAFGGYPWIYNRIGNVVTVSGGYDVNNCASNQQIQFTLPIPPDNTWAAVESECNGSGVGQTVGDGHQVVRPIQGEKVCTIHFMSTVTGRAKVNFQYRIDN
jgi:hypothetical protein